MVITLFGDSELLIKVLNTGDHFNNSNMNILLQRIQVRLKEFDMVESFHILRELDSSADSLANNGSLLPQGFLSINGAASYFHSIP